MRNKPPIGVIGPIQARGIEVRCAVDRKYNEPLNNRIPKMKNKALN
jgi:hypothetical protein